MRTMQHDLLRVRTRSEWPHKPAKTIMRAALVAAVAPSCIALGGCINIAAPEEPIVIELNINIRQEVIYRLAEDAANTIEENSDIF